VSDLIDTTEMYLRTIYELVEEGIIPLRARIAERLHQSGPTVSQTVARMERDGLVTVEGDRHLELTDEGNQLATRVMRKHRLAERLLTDVIGLDWEVVHAEACRWEHVMSETVERRLIELLGHPTLSPYGNPIPGLHELGESSDEELFMTDVEPLDKMPLPDGGVRVRIRRISEELQKDEPVMAALRRVGAAPAKGVTGGHRADFFDYMDATGVTRYLPVFVYPKGAPEKAAYFGHRLEKFQTQNKPLWTSETQTSSNGCVDSMQMACDYIRKAGPGQAQFLGQFRPSQYCTHSPHMLQAPRDSWGPSSRDSTC